MAIGAPGYGYRLDHNRIRDIKPMDPATVQPLIDPWQTVHTEPVSIRLQAPAGVSVSGVDVERVDGRLVVKLHIESSK